MPSLDEPFRRVTTADGCTLGVRRLRPAAPSGAMLLLHAMMADARSLDRGGLATTLADAGFDVFVADFRGRGASPLPPGRAWTYDDLVFRDLPALVADVRRACDGPVAVVGHSLGGHVAAAAVASGAVAVDALVGVAANVWAPHLEHDPVVRTAKDATVCLFGAVASPLRRFPARALRIGPVDESAAYVDDLVRFWRTGRWTDRAGRHDWLAERARVEIPVLVVLGTGDALLARPPGAARWAAGFPRHDLWLAGGGAHGVAGAPGHMELVTDPACAPLHREVAAWLRRALSPGASAR